MRSLFLLTFVGALFFTGCGGEGACCGQGSLVQSKEVAGLSNETNKTPVAIISGLASTTDNCKNAKANSNLSYDTDGDIESYIWNVDGVNVAQDKNPDSILPCENDKTIYQVCLTVVDDDGAFSNQTCQIIKITQKSNFVPIERTHFIPNIEIPQPFRDGTDYIFDVCEQTFDGHVIESHHWVITKHFKDGATATHTNNTCRKTIYSEIKEFESVDVTLTITFTDGHSKTTTNSYIQVDDAPPVLEDS